MNHEPNRDKAMLHMNNGEQTVSGLTPTQERRILTGASAAWQAVRWIIAAAVTALTVYYGVVSRQAQAEGRLDALQASVARLDSIAQTKEAADAQDRLVIEKLDRIADKVSAIKERLDRLEERRR